MISGKRPLLRRLFLDYSRPDSFGSRFRVRRAVVLRQLIHDIAPVAADGRRQILDIGGLPAYWRLVGLDWLRAVDARVTLVNLHPINVPPAERDVLESVAGDGCDLDGVPDRSFDLAHSNSVIEHVGGPDRMTRFADEIRRVGRGYYVQTPNYWFPIEPHYVAPVVHWLPARLRTEMVWRGLIGTTLRPANREDAARIVQQQQLLTRRRMRALFPDAEHLTERFCGLPKSLIAIRTPPAGVAALPFTTAEN